MTVVIWNTEFHSAFFWGSEMFQENVVCFNEMLQNITIKIKNNFIFFQNKIFIISASAQIWKTVFIVIQTITMFSAKHIYFIF